MPIKFTKKIINSLNRGVLEQLDLSKSIKHPAENGRAREQIIAEYLEKILPKKVKVDTGFIIDARGGVSKQIDVIIYRDAYHSVFEIGKIKYFMVESVVAVIENKASILSNATLSSALENIKSVKSLDRTNNGKNIILPSGQKVDENNFQHQIFGAIITENSLTTDTLKGAFTTFFNSNIDMKLWVNMYVDVRGSSVRYVNKKMGVTAIPKEAYALYISDPDAENYTPPLLEITFELINFIRVSPEIDFNPTDYFYGTAGKAKECVEFPKKLLEACNIISSI